MRFFCILALVEGAAILLFLAGPSSAFIWILLAIAKHKLLAVHILEREVVERELAKTIPLWNDVPGSRGDRSRLPQIEIDRKWTKIERKRDRDTPRSLDRKGGGEGEVGTFRGTRKSWSGSNRSLSFFFRFFKGIWSSRRIRLFALRPPCGFGSEY